MGYGLGRQSVPSDGFHQVAEPIEFVQGRVDVWRDPDSFELFMQDRRRENTVFVEEITPDRRRIYACNVDVRNRARLFWIK